ncbi:hypothetical protein A7A08_01679 [Methyloligella halotolerans]|uniref:Protein of unknwon function (DUF3310) n=1 Tax=Methyloligella halotolerans TaxID=1177755 RepID=A0A1E2RZK4_9HYPH|nr:DUF3310 domain-containing protein [Methyloligella halotolerans]ODA67644.1 hypothetical protein A7A08_01679 [Methyloligella halotolerans]
MLASRDPAKRVGQGEPVLRLGGEHWPEDPAARSDDMDRLAMPVPVSAYQGPGDCCEGAPLACQVKPDDESVEIPDELVEDTEKLVDRLVAVFGEAESREGEGAVSTVAHPPHYTAHPSGVECITVAEHFNFNLGNVLKYVWRAGLKGDHLEDLEKARQYLDFEIAKRRREAIAQ